VMREGRYAEAEKWTREGIEKSVRLLGPESPNTAMAVYNLACIEALSGRPDAALSHLKPCDRTWPGRRAAAGHSNGPGS
jgi:Tetratricopeptide repeat